MTNWKERFKPANKTERTFFLFIFFVGAYAIAISLSDRNDRTVPVIYNSFLLLCIIFMIARPIYHKIQSNYDITKVKAIVISGIWATLLFFIGVMLFGVSAVLATILFSPFPEWVEQVIWFLGMVILFVKLSSIVNPVQQFVFEKILKLQPREPA